MTGGGSKRERRARALARRSNAAATGQPGASKAFSRLHARLYRRTGGRFIPRWFGAPVLVLETIGRRSGEPRATPILYLRRGDDFVVYAANAGAHRVPAWWLNLRESGEGQIAIAGERSRVHPRVLEGAEREHAYEEFCEMYPQARDYPSFTDRPMPLIALEPA